MTSSSEEIKPIALSIVELCLVEGISKLVNQLVENNNFLEGFRVDQKTFLAWLCLTNTARLLKRKCKGGYWVIFWAENPKPP